MTEDEGCPNAHRNAQLGWCHRPVQPAGFESAHYACEAGLLTLAYQIRHRLGVTLSPPCWPETRICSPRVRDGTTCRLPGDRTIQMRIPMRIWWSSLVLQHAGSSALASSMLMSSWRH